MAGITEKLLTQPGDLYALSGGTRNKVVLNRPWQMELPYAPEKCPFCTKEEPEEMTVLPNWRVLRNPMTPHAFHRLVIPRKCPTREETRTLGGTQAIEEALTIYSKVIPVATREGFLRTSYAVHVGMLAGQNLGHMHWHVCDAENPVSPVEKAIKSEIIQGSFDEKRIVFERYGFIAYAEGARAGQIYLVPLAMRCIDNSTVVENLSSALFQIVELYNSKFLSFQGLPPEFMVAVVCHQSWLRYATYVPILHQLGFPHYLALSGDSKMTIPWPHELTVEHLKS